jgi:hypothetical protein
VTGIGGRAMRLFDFAAAEEQWLRVVFPNTKIRPAVKRFVPGLY